MPHEKNNEIETKGRTKTSMFSFFFFFFVFEPEIFALYLKIIQAKLHKYKKNSTNKYEREMEDSFPSELRHHISKKNADLPN